jgi:hypothetical protein
LTRAGNAVLIGLALFASALVTGCREKHCSDTGACAAVKVPHGGARAAAIYAAVVRQLVTKDNTFGAGAAPFEHIFVLDHTFTRTGKPHPLGSGVQGLVARRLGDLGPLDFVSDPKSVIEPNRGCAVVKQHGALVTLGPIARAKAGKVHVRAGLFFACLGGTGLTYALEPAHRNWRVIGTVGGVAVS